MLFTTDQQTVEDLNIFGKHSSVSIYAMYNRTYTRGGAALLEEMFRFPLSNAADINKRSGLISYFTINQSFPFDNELFDIVELYLDNTDERTKLSQEGDTVVKKLSNLIAEDAGQKFITIGVTSMLAILQSLQGFIQTLTADKNLSYREDIETIEPLLAQPALSTLPAPKTRLTYSRVAELDVLLRFKHRDTLKKLLRYIYYYDVYLSVGRIAIERGFVLPEATASGGHSLTIKGLYHPQLKGAVPNDVSLTPQNNLVFLTGANMAGKSTFMKSLGTAMYLAHMGFPVAATHMQFTVMDGIYTTINLPDNLGAGTSHFYAEVLRVKKIAKELALNKNLFVIVDELFRGTNVKDAYEATLAITTGFAKRLNSVFVISTHIIETAAVLKKIPNISFKYLPTVMNNNEPVYTYTLKEGVTNDRHGMVIINNEGIIAMLLKGKGQAV